MTVNGQIRFEDKESGQIGRLKKLMEVVFQISSKLEFAIRA